MDLHDPDADVSKIKSVQRYISGKIFWIQSVVLTLSCYQADKLTNRKTNARQKIISWLVFCHWCR